MKILMSVILIILGISTGLADNQEDLNLTCQASNGSTFLIDQFHSKPCRIRHIQNGKEEQVIGVSLCLYPNEVHDSFSFWWFVPNRGRAELLGVLELVGHSYRGRLSYETENAAGLASLVCNIE